MHTFEWLKVGYPVRFHFNSDFGGNVIITKGDFAIEIPMDALGGFYLRLGELREESQRVES